MCILDDLLFILKQGLLYTLNNMEKRTLQKFRVPQSNLSRIWIKCFSQTLTPTLEDPALMLSTDIYLTLYNLNNVVCIFVYNWRPTQMGAVLNLWLCVCNV